MKIKISAVVDADVDCRLVVVQHAECGQEGEFGYGWSLDLSNTQVEVKYPANTAGSAPFEGIFPLFRDGTRVIITFPDGKHWVARPPRGRVA